jgi:hypothetical protein
MEGRDGMIIKTSDRRPSGLLLIFYRGKLMMLKENIVPFEATTP